VPKKILPHSAKGKAKGWFFSEFETFPVVARGALYGQMNADSCVAACARMMAADAGIEIPESYLRGLLQIEDGGYLSDLPNALQTIGLTSRYEYRRDLTFVALQEAVRVGSAVAYLENPQRSGHAVVIEAITDEFVTVRDPLPRGEGRAYQVHHADFLRFWLLPESDRGRAVIVVR
jgi:ABC-type bacteriocin/lantibiotic exporter with double-glycine peptidase domain